MKKSIKEMSLKELFKADLTALIQEGDYYGLTSHENVKEYIVKRCQIELGIDNDNFYTLKKLVLRSVVEVDEYDYEYQKIEIEHPSGEWEKLKQSNIYKQIMKKK